jgi:hypothetical protein
MYTERGGLEEEEKGEEGAWSMTLVKRERGITAAIVLFVFILILLLILNDVILLVVRVFHVALPAGHGGGHRNRPEFLFNLSTSQERCAEEWNSIGGVELRVHGRQ